MPHLCEVYNLQQGRQLACCKKVCPRRSSRVWDLTCNEPCLGTSCRRAVASLCCSIPAKTLCAANCSLDSAVPVLKFYRSTAILALHSSSCRTGVSILYAISALSLSG